MIKHISTKQLGKHLLCAVVLSLGSNHKAQKTLALAYKELGRFGVIDELAWCHSPDHTGRSVAWYHNVALVLGLSTPMPLPALLSHLKAIEFLCGRKQNVALVAMDIDVVAVQMAADTQWYLMAERCPLKDYERQCLAPFWEMMNG